jgi:hypothetical protein
MYPILTIGLVLFMTSFSQAQSQPITPHERELLTIIARNVDKMNFEASGRKKPSVSELSAIQSESVDRCTAYNFLQKHFLRPGERLSLGAVKFYNNIWDKVSKQDKDRLMGLFREMSLIDELVPEAGKHYQYILVHGSTVQNMRERLANLDAKVRSGVVVLYHDTQIIFAVGHRKLFTTETIAVIKDPAPYKLNPYWELKEEPTNEIEAARIVWEQLDLSPELRDKEPFFTDAPASGVLGRANTADTVHVWLEKFHPTSDDLCLSVSSQPFGLYQERVVEKKAAKDGVYIDCDPLATRAEVEKYSQNVALGVLIDTGARLLDVEVGGMCR